MGKARTYYVENRAARSEWRLSVAGQCMVCGWLESTPGGFQWLETHEIEQRSAAPTRWADPCNYLLVCNQCHSERITLMSHAEQLALKWENDPTNFDLDVWLRIRDPELRAPTRVTMEDIETCF